MTAISHPVRHRFQTTNFNCGQAALAMLLEHLGETMSVEDVEKVVGNHTGDAGAEWGSFSSDLANWCLSRGYAVDFHTFDCRVIDLSWASLAPAEIRERLVLLDEAGHAIPSLGRKMTSHLIRSFDAFIAAGGNLVIRPSPTIALLKALLQKGPFLPTVCFNTLHGLGRTRAGAVSETFPDDIKGGVGTHLIVVYGCDVQGNFLFADPWEAPGLHIADGERLLSAIMAAGRDCESQLFQVYRR